MKFSENFKEFWNCEMIKYSPYGSRLLNEEERRIKGFSIFEPSLIEKQQEIKNSPNFYYQAPFLTIAEDLLKLIKEGKVEQLIFLSAYDKRVKYIYTNETIMFSDKFGDPRKIEIFKKTFEKLCLIKKSFNTRLQLIGFDSESQGQSKAD